MLYSLIAPNLLKKLVYKLGQCFLNAHFILLDSKLSSFCTDHLRDLKSLVRGIHITENTVFNKIRFLMAIQYLTYNVFYKYISFFYECKIFRKIWNNILTCICSLMSVALDSVTLKLAASLIFSTRQGILFECNSSYR